MELLNGCLFFFWFEHDSRALAAVNGHGQRMVEADDAYAVRLVDGRKRVEVADVVDAVVAVRIDGEISYAERCQVVEEMCALARFDAVIVER